ncbi:S-adenosyl-L-methionine-dependent methyltransferase domain-containing protein [Trifolium pratense]|uniref:S-adenosyl-L-methionine-dependent methyltransferase domain-containing protein n=1 Tax=Trifolium pratense TaxID=57577 RepID=A0A2K3N8A0_TRIPR|nr:uncharacterized protein LOC123883484 [Trifolium pratense]PNX99268.1 S-adenosyl-L-methionine-dependent methyltransferase domain-containing protein [Trifolium pratense]
MKTEHNNNKRLSVTIITIIKPAAYVILLVLTYTLGYLSHSFSTIALPPPILSPQLPPTPPHISSSVLRLSVVNGTELDPFRVKTLCADPIPPENIRQTIINHIFNGDSPFLNFPPPHAAAILHRSTKVKGWGSNGAVFENLIRKVKPKIIVEVGTFLGASAIHMAELTQRLGLNTQILCIDDFRGWAGFRDQFKNIAMLNGDVLLYYQFLQNVVTFKKTGSVLPVPFSSGSALMKLCEWGVWADLVEIDAGHDFLSAWSDINRGLRILRPGGVIFGHDYFTAADNKGVRRAVDLFAKIHGFKVNIDGQHWVIYTTIH